MIRMALVVGVVLLSSCSEAVTVAPDQQYVTAAGHQHQLVDQQYMTAEEWYPNTDEAPTGHEGLHELQQQATMQKLSAVQPLLKWLKANQAEVNVQVHEAGPGAGLGLFAAKDVQEGGVLLSLPTDLGFSRKTANGVMDFLLDYVLDMSDPHSLRALMWRTAPRPHELRHLLNFPPSYLPLLQHPQLEEWIGGGLHHDLSMFYRMHGSVLAAAGVTYADLVHAMGMLGTRMFNKPEPDGRASTYYALPLLDMANHDNACPHYNVFRPCEFDSSRECVYLMAGADVAAGQEVCFFYGYMLPDRALLEYGFLQQQPQLQGAPQLFGIDRHDADFDTEPLAKLVAQPEPFVGAKQEDVVARITKLQQLLAQLGAANTVAADVAAEGPAPGDEGGLFLQQLMLWRQQRQQAVAAEIERLELQLQRNRQYA